MSTHNGTTCSAAAMRGMYVANNACLLKHTARRRARAFMSSIISAAVEA
eukprot:CAMPEP_0167827896 /NCGR_PEP_ID=MMETSP0112_2-20121227/11009_1 /TAXON_ID=91324 /ORGANISM="Lotharella globosa, Strain CCCM811" /LENGTH=48 /DNA_ID= /DNA_START= /DNA_END= /DNA_ORIENTATION=